MRAFHSIPSITGALHDSRQNLLECGKWESCSRFPLPNYGGKQYSIQTDHTCGSSICWFVVGKSIILQVEDVPTNDIQRCSVLSHLLATGSLLLWSKRGALWIDPTDPEAPISSWPVPVAADEWEIHINKLAMFGCEISAIYGNVRGRSF